MMDVRSHHTDSGPAMLICSAAAKAPLLAAARNACKRLDKPMRIVAADLDPNVITRYLADEFWQVPPTQDDLFIEVLEECFKRDIRIILPTRDGELAFWAQHADQLAESSIQVIVSPKASIDLCLDKLAFSEFGIQQGLPFIPSYLNPDMTQSCDWVVKERFGAGSRSIGLNLSTDAALLHAKQLRAPIFQPQVYGDEISIDAWLNKRYQVKGLVVRRRTRVVNGESQVTTTLRDDGLEAQARSIFEQLKLSGPVVMQAIIDSENQLHIIECNPRIGGASTASLKVGLDSLYWSIQEALGKDIDAEVFVRQPDITQVRIPYDIYFPAT